MSWDAIIFDCDGVLVDSEPIANRILADMLGEIGLPLTLEQTVERFVGRSIPSCLALIEAELGHPAPSGFAGELHERCVAAFERELEPTPGAAELLDRLPWPYCVASSGDHEKLRATLTRTGLYPRVAGRIYSAADVARGKPHPDLFLHAAAEMGARPERCAVVEDSVPGVEAGRAAGMTVIGFAGTHPADRLRDAGAPLVVHSMSELLPLLDRHAPGAEDGGPVPDR